MIKSENINLIKLSALQFKHYLKTKNDESKWFYWHLSANLQKYHMFSILINNGVIGVACLFKDKSKLVDIYIEKKFRRLGYGGKAIEYFISNFKNSAYKVNRNNIQSILFFDFLLSKAVLKNKDIISHEFVIYS